MKELSQIRMAVLDALRGAGIQAMEVFPEKKAMAWLRRWVSARPAEKRRASAII